MAISGWPAPRTCVGSAVVAVALAVLMAGCGGSSHRTGPIGGAIYRRDEAHWSMPVDAFRVDVPRLEYAEDILMDRCMKHRRMAWSTPVLRPPAPAANDAEVILFTLPLARQYGYHPGPPSTVDPPPAPPPPAIQHAADACLRQLRRRIPAIGMAQMGIYTLAAGASEEAQGSAKVLAAAARWRRCMQPQGISDLPTVPWSMPSPSMRAQFHMGEDPVPGQKFTTRGASPGEIAMAVFDARCRISSGVTRLDYQAEWDAELRLIDQHRDDIERAAAFSRRVTAQIDRVIADGGG